MAQRSLCLLLAVAAVALGQDAAEVTVGKNSKIPAPFKPRCMGTKPCNMAVESKVILNKAMDTLEVATKALNKGTSMFRGGSAHGMAAPACDLDEDTWRWLCGGSFSLPALSFVCAPVRPSQRCCVSRPSLAA